MLPGPRIVLVAITATFAFVVLAFAQLVKLQVAQSHSASFGPVEARFAGLAFAERADWTPVATSRARSMEALAPFGNLPSIQLRRHDREAAGAPIPIQIAALEQPTAVPDTPAIKLAPVTVASIGPTNNSEASPVTPEPAATAEQLPQAALPEAATLDTATPETATPETVDNPVQGVAEGTENPVADIAALSPPPTVLTPAVAALGSAEVPVAAIHAPVDPVPAALSATVQAVAAPDAAAASPEPPKQVAALPDETPKPVATRPDETLKQVAALPDETPNGNADGEAITAPAPRADITRLPLPRPVIAALPDQIVPMPTPRPNITPAPRRKAQPRPRRKRARAVRRRAVLARPARPTQPVNPFAALFGGPPNASTARR